jgi:predicted alpha/beta-fold hydrolase
MMEMTQDGAKIAVDWEVPPNSNVDPQIQKQQVLHGIIRQPVVLILHGINNDTSFGYMRSLMRACSKRGWIAAGMNFRGCGGVPLATPRSYNGGYTGDLRCVVWRISARLAKGIKIFIVGNSLGANLITKYLGEEGLSETLPECVAGGISLGNPLVLNGAGIHFPWNYLLGLGAKKGLLQHWRTLRLMKAPQYQSAVRDALVSGTIGDFDEAMAPIFIRNSLIAPYAPKIGYKNAKSYWTDASSYRLIRHISVPTLVLTSQDDFLVHHGSMAKLAYCLANPNVIIVNTKCGGHLGWHECPPDGNMFVGTSWADTATMDFIDAVLQGHGISDEITGASERTKSALQGQAVQYAAEMHSRL